MRKLLYIAGITLLAACHGNSTEETSMTKADATPDVSHVVKAAADDLKKLKFDYSKDPACGAALSEGIGDSTEYKGKLYGFCSKECKDKFLKSPESFLARLVTP